MAAAFESLPEELMTLILLKLPVKSLLRLKCVQKSWYSLIKSPQFVHLHHRSSSSSTSNTKPDCFIVVRRIPLERHVLTFNSCETLNVLGNEINLPISGHRHVAWLCGSCDGLVCISDDKNQIVICNPTIRELRSLSFPPSLGNRSDYDIDSIAFGSDPNTGQYTLVMIGGPFDSPRYHDFSNREAQVYNFSTDSWRETAAVTPGPFFYHRRAISFNGAFHWCPSGKSNILTFHISSNEVTEFEFIPLPDFLEISGKKELNVTSNKSQLSLILYYRFGGWLEVCVMTEYGVKESWTRLFKIETMLCFFGPFSFWDEHQLLIRNSHGYVFSCNLQNENILHLPIAGDFDLCPYSQSLVSVNGIGHPII